ncbi:TPA: coproporphyrinogen III oxidase, partial [Pseudomonas aeruginosa]|nr:coproporphyrinogen III oxidase [Pseudomonas aeruginosa]
TMLELTTDLAEALSLPMSVIWAAIGSWIDQNLV